MSTIVTIRKGIEIADRVADLIANPDPSKPFSNAIGAAGRRACDSWSSADPSSQLFFAQVIPGGIGGAALLNTVCKPYLDGAGFDPPGIEPAFVGGQCAKMYNISGFLLYFQLNCQTGFGQDSQDNIGSGITLMGPLTNLRTELLEQGSCPPGRTRMLIDHAGGTRVLTDTTGVNRRRSDLRPNVTVTAVDGIDDCGNDPTGGTLVPGPNPAPSPGPFPPGENPGVDPTGQPFFFVPDIEDPFGDIPIGDDPFAPATPPGAGSGGDGLPGDPEAIGDEAGEVSGGEDGEDIDFGEPPEGRVWIGCIVETSSIGAVGNIAGTGPQSTVWPTVRANAALIYGSKKGTSNRINSKFHDLIRSATSLVVTGVFLQVLPGSTSKVFPLSALKCPSNPCEEE